MPYPTGTPIAKHDILRPPLPSSNQSFLSSSYSYQFSNNSPVRSIFDKLESPGKIIKEQIKEELSTVYTYPDAPKRPGPLSRELFILGFVDCNISLIQKITDPHSSPPCIQKCTMAVKRADARYRSSLRPPDLQISENFASFMQKLRNDGAVAITAADKYGRFGILVPMEGGGGEGEYNKNDFAVNCFVGKVEEVKELMQSAVDDAGVETADAEPTFQPDDDYDDGPTFQPDNDAPAFQPDEDTNGGDGFWKPPSGEENGNPTDGFGGGGEGDGLWKPPEDNNENGDGGMDWGAGAEPTNGFDSWQAAPPPTDNGGMMMSGQKRDRSDFEADDGADNDNNDGSGGGGGNATFHADTGAAAADKFYSGLTRTLDTRADSRLYHMRAFNGWVKATQIAELDPKTKKRGKRAPLRVLDLACGKGGDLGKWTLHVRGVDNYVGVDVARGSLKDAAVRARKMRNKLPRCTFTCADLGADVPGRLRSKNSTKLQKLLSWSLGNEADYEAADPVFKNVSGGGIATEDKFDVVSIQFAIHYMMSTRQRARRFFQTVSELLEVGGNLIATTIDARVVLKHMMGLGLDLQFDDDEEEEEETKEGEKKGPYATVKTGNGACRLKFEKEIVKRLFKSQGQGGEKPTEDDMFGLEYTFTLVEGEDHSAGVGEAVDLPEWLTPIPALTALGKEAGLELEYACNFHEFYAARKDPSEHPSSHNALYNMKVLDRNGSISKDEWEISRMYKAVKFRKVRESTMVLEDDGEVEEEEEEEEEAETSAPPVMSAAAMKMVPMAMIKAKRAAGEDLWASLSGDEKKQRIDQELAKMI